MSGVDTGDVGDGERKGRLMTSAIVEQMAAAYASTGMIPEQHQFCYQDHVGRYHGCGLGVLYAQKYGLERARLLDCPEEERIAMDEAAGAGHDALWRRLSATYTADMARIVPQLADACYRVGFTDGFDGLDEAPLSDDPSGVQGFADGRAARERMGLTEVTRPPLG
jgi:hypothetical protein